MSEPTITELDRAIEYLETALKVSQANERAALEVIAQERREVRRLRARLNRCCRSLARYDRNEALRFFEPVGNDVIGF